MRHMLFVLLLVAVVGCGPAEITTVKNLGMSFVTIPAGTFMMGDANGDADETPHQVTLTKGFELGVYEVTQEQYEQVMGSNPSHFKGPQNPVEQVSWNDAVEFCRKLSALPSEKSAGYVYRLPTEAEWGVCVPRGDGYGIQFWRQRIPAGRLRVVRRELWPDDTSGWW